MRGTHQRAVRRRRPRRTSGAPRPDRCRNGRPRDTNPRLLVERPAASFRAIRQQAATTETNAVRRAGDIAGQCSHVVRGYSYCRGFRCDLHILQTFSVPMTGPDARGWGRPHCGCPVDGSVRVSDDERSHPPMRRWIMTAATPVVIACAGAAPALAADPLLAPTSALPGSGQRRRRPGTAGGGDALPRQLRPARRRALAARPVPQAQSLGPHEVAADRPVRHAHATPRAGAPGTASSRPSGSPGAIARTWPPATAPPRGPRWRCGFSRRATARRCSRPTPPSSGRMSGSER